ncbi:MAG: GNAT family N-acetyltransferase [Kangiellaceae bacterium]|jgi:diamine N-acetyltransferase
MIKFTELHPENAKRLSDLAKPIWQEHYTPIIGAKQVSYMLDKFQSESAILQQLTQGYRYFEVYSSEKLMGYFSVQLRDSNSFFISKFYLANHARGKKLGSAMLEHIKQLALKAGCKHLDLTVNKYNPAYQIYLKLGFVNIGSVEFDIGGGYIMDDYLMRKELNG